MIFGKDNYYFSITEKKLPKKHNLFFKELFGVFCKVVFNHGTKKSRLIRRDWISDFS